MIISIILSLFVLLITTIFAVYLRIDCIAISTGFGIVFLILTLLFSFFGAYFAISKAVKNRKKRYVLFMLIPIVVFLAQIIFKDKIWEIWEMLFRRLPSPSTLPTLV